MGLYLSKACTNSKAEGIDAANEQVLRAEGISKLKQNVTR